VGFSASQLASIHIHFTRQALARRRIARRIGGGALRDELRAPRGQPLVNPGLMIEGVDEGAAGGILSA